MLELADRAVHFFVSRRNRDRSGNKTAENTAPESGNEVLVAVELKDDLVPRLKPQTPQSGEDAFGIFEQFQVASDHRRTVRLHIGYGADRVGFRRALQRRR